MKLVHLLIATNVRGLRGFYPLGRHLLGHVQNESKMGVGEGIGSLEQLFSVVYLCRIRKWCLAYATMTYLFELKM
jgi:hypothetical protein